MCNLKGNDIRVGDFVRLVPSKRAEELGAYKKSYVTTATHEKLKVIFVYEDTDIQVEDSSGRRETINSKYVQGHWLEYGDNCECSSDENTWYKSNYILCDPSMEIGVKVKSSNGNSYWYPYCRPIRKSTLHLSWTEPGKTEKSKLEAEFKLTRNQYELVLIFIRSLG